jgi:hypothetical protein
MNSYFDFINTEYILLKNSTNELYIYIYIYIQTPCIYIQYIYMYIYTHTNTTLLTLKHSIMF